MYLRRLEQRYMGEQKEIEEMNQTQQPLWLVNNILFCFEGDKHTGNESERKQFLQHKGKHGSSKKNYTDRLKSTGRKVSYATVFTDTTRRGALPEEAFIYTAEMTAIKAALKMFTIEIINSR